MRDFDSIKQKEMGSIENRVRHIYNRGYEDGYKDGRESIIDGEDAISRQAVMECFKKWQPYMATRLWDFEKELFGLPPVTPAEKVGHWEWNQFDDGEVVRCSECKEYNTHERKYCPHCGAKMEVEE